MTGDLILDLAYFRFRKWRILAYVILQIMLPSSLFILTNVLAVSLSLPVATDASSLRQLKGSNFDSSIHSGVWFVEFFSPYCPHCKQFVPTWQRLSDHVESQVDLRITLAQVNCIADQDLCNKVDIKAYPTLRIYRDGKFVEEYNDSKGRSFELLADFVQQRAIKAPKPNPDGSVLALTPNTFDETVKKGPVFVKFFAPWCGHCKKLAPTWTQFAATMRNKLTVAEVNCDDHKSLCSAQKIPGFPSLVFYQYGLKQEFMGSRTLEAFTASAEAALAPPVTSISSSEVDSTIKQQDVLYLLLHSTLEHSLQESLFEASKALHGTPKIFTTPSTPDLLASLSLPATQPLPVLLSIKGHSFQPFQSLDLSTPPSTSLLSDWIVRNSLPTVTQLSGENFAHVMTPNRLVVLVALHPEDNKNREATMEIATKWSREDGKKTDNSGKQIIFAWIDKVKYVSWLKSLYGVMAYGDPAVVLVDHGRLVYYDTMLDGSPIPLDLAEINVALKAVEDNTLVFKNSENWAERIARRINNITLAIQSAVSNHPFLAFFVAGFAVFGIISMVRKALREDAKTSSSMYINSKSGSRLD